VSKEDRLIFNGVVVQVLREHFKVRLETGQEVMCTLTGNIRRNNVRVLLNDSVQVEISAFDIGKGRIVRRERLAPRKP
jgi:translation initiation factor IF-1